MFHVNNKCSLLPGCQNVSSKVKMAALHRYILLYCYFTIDKYKVYTNS